MKLRLTSFNKYAFGAFLVASANLPAFAGIFESSSSLMLALESSEQSNISEPKPATVQEPKVNQPVDPVVPDPVMNTAPTEPIKLNAETTKIINSNPVTPPPPAPPSISFSSKKDTYQGLIDKSLKSIEQDPWTDAKANLDEVLNYFTKEKEAHTFTELDNYLILSQAIRRFCDGGSELDEKETPNYNQAKKIYVESRKLADLVAEKLSASPNASLQASIDMLQTHISEELQYIEEMLSP